MKNFKDITISIFAIIGFVAILSSFNNQSEAQVTHSTVPESHVWEFGNDDSDVYIFNKVTGEVRALTGASPTKYGIYKTLKEDPK